MGDEKKFLAHTSPDGRLQTLKKHSENVAALCSEFAGPQLQGLAYLAGLLHDIGKYQESFGRRLRGEKIRVEHSTCGAKAAYEKYGVTPAGLLLAYIIMGHHSGLPDAGTQSDTSDMTTFYARLKRNFESYAAYQEELQIPELDLTEFRKLLMQDCDKDSGKLVDKFAFLTRFCASCLVDADSLDTANFCNGELPGKIQTDFEACLEDVNQRLDSFVCKTELQKARGVLQRQALSKTEINADVYLMNMPTGSGKTLCSIKLALERLVKSRRDRSAARPKKRIIYIIPFNSIIDQTYREFHENFGKHAEILRHQSTFSYEEEDRKETEQKLIEDDSEDYKRLARNAIENWDADSIIITTAVQFFESVYSNRRSKLRKLHNMADSILVFDEAHLMPKEYLQPCLQGIVYLTRYCNSEAIFLTATMPDFRQLMEKYALKGQRICNLIEDTSSFSVFRKCHYRFVGELSEEELIQRAKQFPSSLIIANSRKKVRDIYCLCTGKKFHLSTYMTPCDREVALENIRKELAQLELDFPDGENVPPERRITIVSTSLIEAGVDLDMYAVFRELDGLDSILQAGGRCNREGKRSGAEVFIFELPQNSRADQDGRRSITKGILQEYEDISMPECIRDYYGRLLGLNHEKLIQNTLSRQCSHIANIPFRSYAESFKVIDSKHQSLIVPRDDRCRELVWKLQTEGSRMETSRQLQRYACSIYQSELDDLIRQHVVQDYGTGIYCLTNPDYYDNEIGIIFEASDYFME